MNFPNMLWKGRSNLPRGAKASQRAEDGKGYPAEQPAYHPNDAEPARFPQLPYSFGMEEIRHGWMPERGRIPRLWYPNLTMLAGLHTQDAANQFDHGKWLPVAVPPQRGGMTKSVSGGRNTVSNRMADGMTRIPSVFVPIGRR